jgi:hypothetical protein
MYTHAQGSIEVVVQNVSFTSTGSTTGTLTFTVAARKGSNYSSGGTGGLFSSNLRYDIQVVTSPTSGSFTVSNGSGSLNSINTTILTGGVTNASSVPAYAPQGTSPTGTNASVGFTMTRNNSTDPDLPSSSSSYTTLFTVSYPYTITSGYSVNSSSSAFFLRTLSGTRGSSWSSFSASGNSFTVGTAALPISITKFEASATDGRRTRLNWDVVQEKNINRYEVERSNDGGVSFNVVVASIKAAENGRASMQYQSYDNSPMEGDNFYRLRILERSGEHSYSITRKVHFNGSKGDIVVYPTPTRDGIVYIKLPEERDGTLFQVFNASGQIIPVAVEGSNTNRTINLRNLAAGIYTLSTNYDGPAKSFKIVYQP